MPLRPSLIAILLMAPVTAMAEESQATASIAPLDDPARVAKYETRCASPGDLFQITLSKSQTQDVYSAGIIRRQFAAPGYLIERRGNEVRTTLIEDPSPEYSDIMSMRFGIKVELIACASAFAVSYLDGEMQLSGESEFYEFSRDLTFEEVAQIEGAIVDIRYAQSLYRSDNAGDAGGVVTVPRPGLRGSQGRTFYERDLLDGISISVQGLPITMRPIVADKKAVDEIVGFDIGFKVVQPTQ